MYSKREIDFIVYYKKFVQAKPLSYSFQLYRISEKCLGNIMQIISDQFRIPTEVKYLYPVIDKAYNFPRVPILFDSFFILCINDEKYDS